MNTYEITLTPLYVAPTPDDIIPAFDKEVIRVSGTSMEVSTAGYDSEYLIIRNGKEIVYMTSAHMVRSCKKIIRKKRAKVLQAVADKV